jgi:ribonuclease Z
LKKVFSVAVAMVVLIGAAAALVFNVPAAQDAVFKRAATAVLGQTPEPLDGMRVIVCGSASPLGRDLDRAQACIAVVTNEHFFLFDVGARSPLRMAQARLPMARINGVFLTHFHSDHIAALPDVNLASWVQGRPAALDVYGPPGVQSVVDGFNTAYGLDRGYRTAHHGAARLPPELGPMRAHPFDPGEVVWQDDFITVTSFAVEHPPIEPAVGYRVDYRGRSVVTLGHIPVTRPERRESPNCDAAGTVLSPGIKWRARYDSRVRLRLTAESSGACFTFDRPANASASAAVRGAPGTTRTFDPQLRKTIRAP